MYEDVNAVTFHTAYPCTTCRSTHY